MANSFPYQCNNYVSFLLHINNDQWIAFDFKFYTVAESFVRLSYFLIDMKAWRSGGCTSRVEFRHIVDVVFLLRV